MSFEKELIATAKKIAQRGKGILAADESTGTIGQRFSKINLENVEENRRAYRELLFTAPGKWEEYISGVILYEETLYQKDHNGKPFVELLNERGVVPGIKTDKGQAQIPYCETGETYTQGLDGLADRCKKYYSAGARFAKWRAVISISDTLPSELCIQEQARGLAMYATISQQNGLVPIVEPEVLMDGKHSIEQAAQITEHVQAVVMKALHDAHVLWEGMLLKPNMVLPGQDHPSRATITAEQIAYYTVRTLARTLPAAVPGVNFLSGGQSEEEATVNLNAINKCADFPKPWNLSFSYGRALQSSCIKAWNGSDVASGQKAYLLRAFANSQAAKGEYESQGGDSTSNESLFEKNYKY